MKYLLLVIFLLSKNLFAMEISCIFEEVHQNGDSHQGYLIVKDKKFRYQYLSNNLYTIIHKEDLFFYIENRDKSKYFKLNENTEVLESVIEIINDFPDVKNEYFLKDTHIKVEYSKSEKIIKRIIILSNKINMSVYLKDCKYDPIKNLYFSWSPFWEYNF